MDIGERVKMIRKEKKLTQGELGKILGISKSAVSIIESGSGSLSERNAKAICREFNVDYFWLTEGTGDMFLEPPDSKNKLIELVASQYDLDEKSIQILETYLASDDKKRKSINEFLVSLAESLKKTEE